VKSLHPECCSYTDVYRQHDLLTDRTILAHGIHLQPDERHLIKVSMCV
jgi:guanine deaminase